MADSLPEQPTIKFDTDFPCANATDFQQTAPREYTFRLRKDTAATDCQWYHFRIRGAKDTPLTFRLLDTPSTNVPLHWDNARPVFSSDGGRNWQHVAEPGKHRDGTFTFRHQPQSNQEFIAFHHPYGLDRSDQVLEQWSRHPEAERTVIGRSVQGREIGMVAINAPNGAPPEERIGIWVVCRQHAGETSASWTLEGFVQELLADTPTAKALRHHANINIVPMLNPDGVQAGHYRTNIKGVNLNRMWGKADLENSPEIYHLERQIDRWVRAGNRYDLFLDFHSDSEALCHYAFHASEADRPRAYPAPDRYHADSVRFLKLIARRAADFNPTEGLSDTDPTTGISRSHQMYRHGVMALIFEAGYSRVLFGEQKGHYLTPEHHRAVGRAIAQATAEYFRLTGTVA